MLASCSRNVLKNTLRVPGAVERSASAAVTLQCRAQQQCRNSSRLRRSRDSENMYYRRGRNDDEDYNFSPQETVITRPVAVASPTAKANMEIGRLCDKGRYVDVFNLIKDMKDAGVKPDHITYDHLLSLCAKVHAPIEAWAIFEDMLSMGFYPHRETFHHLILAAFTRDIGDTWNVLDIMAEYDIAPNHKTYELVIGRMTQADNLESALQRLAEMNRAGLTPTLQTAEMIIRLACKFDLPRLALDLADTFEDTAIRRLDGNVWMECLISSAGSLYAEGVIRCWQKVVNELKMIPDEGCCISVLHTVARHQLCALGMDVFRALQTIGVTWEEHHFVPLIEAFCRANKLKEAFGILELMRSNKIEPLPETALPIFEVISQSVEVLDDAWTLLDELYAEGKPIDVVALNTTIRAAAHLGDLQRAVGIYKVFPDFKVKPNVETYNLLLRGCHIAKHRELGDRILTDMREAGIKPNIVTYERLILLCTTQPTYEDAFFYLEEMKASGFKPTSQVYDAIIRKCVTTGDSRYKLALDEMLETGLPLYPRLKSFIDSGGKHDGEQKSSAHDEKKALGEGWNSSRSR